MHLLCIVQGLGVQKLKMPVLEEPEIVGETDV